MKDDIISVISMEFNESGNFLIEDDFVSFEVFRGDFEEHPKRIKTNSINLIFVEKYDDPFFTLCYKIIKG